MNIIDGLIKRCLKRYNSQLFKDQNKQGNYNGNFHDR